MWKMPESTRIGESECYFAANQPMRYGMQIIYSLEVEHCTKIDLFLPSSASWNTAILACDVTPNVSIHLAYVLQMC